MNKSNLRVVNEITIDVAQDDGYHFKVHFDKPHYADLDVDEPAPLSVDQAPNPVRLLAAAVGSCLSASLYFCAKKAHADVGRIQAKVRTEVSRNERGRLRISKIGVEIDPNVPDGTREQLASCVGMFEDFCTVTESVRHGIDISVFVKGATRVDEPDVVGVG